MNQYALYLRKSRADIDAEARGEGETLAKHRTALNEYARRRGLLIVREYAEIVSGDSIAARPQMQALLADVKAGMYAGVIVNDVDRLGRGDSIDQEIIKLTFAASHTLIITPTKDIDFANNTDEDLYDFKAFFARTEYKMISRRMAQGRHRSASAGQYMAGSAPIGYKAIREGKRRTIVPDEQTAPIVRMIFDWYARGEAGYQAIAQRLTAMGIKTNTGATFSVPSVRNILRNPAYIGRYEFGARRSISIIENGQRIKKEKTVTPPIIVGNAHPAIIAPDVWQAVQDRARFARHRCPINTDKSIKNPLAGLVFCSECGHALVKKDTPHGQIMECPKYGCPTSGTYVSTIETALLDILRSWSAIYAEPITRPEPAENVAQREVILHQLDGLASQLARAQELVETGVYTVSEYLSRKSALEARRTALKDELDKLTRKTPQQAIEAILPVCERVLDAYPLAKSAEQKNALLRSVVSRVEYHKTHAAKRNEKSAAFVTLDVYPVINEC